MPQKTRPRARSPQGAPRASGDLTHSTISFPAPWTWLVDEAIPEWVKRAYSPQESWKEKPFSKEDARFFFKGIDELSELFTDERPSRLPAYFTHPRYRSAYLLYFLPLQAAKFLALFHLHRAAVQAALEDGRKQGVLRIGDLGAGPGTASIALLLWLLQEASKEGSDIPPVELHWIDSQRGILRDGQALVESFSSQFPKLRGKVSLHLHVGAWWEAPRLLPPRLSLLFFGNVLNESALPHSLSQREGGVSLWKSLLDRAAGGGILFVEPAHRKSAQLLAGLRDSLIEGGLVEESPSSIWGPCLHAGRCPLGEGRDWCHFSVPASIPGRWFGEFSKGLGSERHWVKFAYLWLSASGLPAPLPSPRLRRVISDPLKKDTREDTILLCEPEIPSRIKVPAAKRIRRGDTISV